MGRQRRSARVSPLAALVTATGVSSTGDGLLLVAAPLLAASLTTRPTAVAAAAVVTRLPWLLAPLAGAVADRVARRQVLAVVEATRAAVLVTFGALVWLHAAPLWQLYMTVFVLACAEMLFVAATLGAVPELVDDIDLPRANGQLYSAQVAGEQFVGPALGGVIFGLGAALPFVIDGVSFAISGLLLLLAFPRRHSKGLAPGGRAPLAEGFDHLRRTAVLRSLTLTIAAFAFCQSLVLSTLVLFAADALQLSTTGFGLFLAVGALGNLIGGLAADRVGRRLAPGALLVVAGVVAAFAYLVAGRTSSVVFAAAAFIVEAVCVSVAMVTTMTLRQRVIPPALHGRVGSLVRSAAYVAMALGAATGGVVVERYGLRMPFSVAGMLQLLAVACIVVPRRSQFDRPEDRSDRPAAFAGLVGSDT